MTAGRWMLSGMVAAVLLSAGLAGVAAGVTGGAAGTRFVVSQRGRSFTPKDLLIRPGDTVEIVNDDGDLRHYAYIDEPGLTSDSGDQEPGAKADILFDKAGTFTVLCGIHPKMRLVVSVRA